jgi:hypothetical protein
MKKLTNHAFLCYNCQSMKLKLKKTPICEVCGEKTAFAFCLVHDKAKSKAFEDWAAQQKPEPIKFIDAAADVTDRTRIPAQGKWMFCCECTSDSDIYYIEFERFFGSPKAIVDWLAHVHHKPWMDWEDFMDMMYRFREETGSFE